MDQRNGVVVVGLGEVGRPLLELVSRHYRTVGVDITPPVEKIENPEFLHICYPFQINDFVGTTARYIERYHPAVTVINSTVAVGTTRAIAERTGAAVAYSPVRGKHARMIQDLMKYAKFVSAVEPGIADRVAAHFQSVGLRTKVLSSPETTELAKLTETTYFGLMIAWAQQLERYCDKWGLDYTEVISFYDEIGFFPPVRYFPGVIGGHCVMPNIEILSKLDHSEILSAIVSSNKKKIEREARHVAAVGKFEPLAASAAR